MSPVNNIGPKGSDDFHPFLILAGGISTMTMQPFFSRTFAAFARAISSTGE